MKARWLAMMLGGGLFGVTALGGAVVGCSSGGVVRDYDFTNAGDRAEWTAEGLSYQGSVGPYAVYRVTASKQRLVGPSVRASEAGVVALASAQNYFVPPKTAAASVRLSLGVGGVVLLDATQTPMTDGQCSPGTTTTGGGGGSGGGGGGGEGGGGSADMSGWGDPCGGGHGGGGSGGNGGGGSGGYGGGSGGSGGYGGGSSGGGYGSGGSGGSGGGYGNPGGLPDGGWNNPGCPTDMGGGGSGGNGGGGSGGNGGGGSGGTGGGGSGGNGGGGSGGNGGGGSGGTGGGGSGGQGGGGSGGTGGGGSGGEGGGGSGGGGGGDSDSTLGPPPAPIYIDFPQPAPVGGIILIQHVTLGAHSPAPRDTPPPVCCTDGSCTTGTTGGGGTGTRRRRQHRQRPDSVAHASLPLALRSRLRRRCRMRWWQRRRRRLASGGDTSDHGPEGAFFANLPSGPTQLAAVCARKSHDAVAARFCAASPPPVTSIVELERAVGLFDAGPPQFALTGHSTSLVVARGLGPQPARHPLHAAVAAADHAGQRRQLHRRSRLRRARLRARLAARRGHRPRPAVERAALLPRALPAGLQRLDRTAAPPVISLTPAVERDWRSVSLYEDEDLKNTVFDCRHCHQPDGPSTTKMLRMQERRAPWTHWFRNNGNQPGGVTLLQDFQAAHGTHRGLRRHPRQPPRHAALRPARARGARRQQQRLAAAQRVQHDQDRAAGAAPRTRPQPRSTCRWAERRRGSRSTTSPPAATPSPCPTTTSRSPTRRSWRR